MDQKLADSLQQITAQLSSMEHDSFLALLDTCSEGEISYFLRDAGTDVNDLTENVIKVNVVDRVTSVDDMDRPSTSYYALDYSGTIRVGKNDLNAGWGPEWPYTIAA